MPVTAIIFFGFNLKNFEAISLKKFLTFDVLKTRTLLSLKLHVCAQTITEAPFIIASLINFSPLFL